MKSIFSKVNYLKLLPIARLVLRGLFLYVDYLYCILDTLLISMSYLDMKCHWIKLESFERETCLLAIRQLKGSHTYDVLAKVIESIYSEFNISDKIIYTTIDNSSNFINYLK